MKFRRLAGLVAVGPVLAAALAAVPAKAEGDAELGSKVFRKCKACHVVGSATNTVGPTLQGLFGRTAGTVEGFRYSKAMTGSGVVWDKTTLGAFLKKPRDYVMGTSMSFVGIENDNDLANLIAYLKDSTK